MPEQEILLRLREIENLLRGKQKDLLTLKQAAQYLSISHSQLYKYTSRRKIPFHKPSGKYLYFFKNELDAWIQQNDEQSAAGGSKDGSQLSEVITVSNQIDLFEEEDPSTSLGMTDENETEPP